MQSDKSIRNERLFICRTKTKWQHKNRIQDRGTNCISLAFESSNTFKVSPEWHLQCNSMWVEITPIHFDRTYSLVIPRWSSMPHAILPFCTQSPEINVFLRSTWLLFPTLYFLCVQKSLQDRENVLFSGMPRSIPTPLHLKYYINLHSSSSDSRKL